MALTIVSSQTASGQYLGSAAIKTIAYNGKTISENITIPAAYNTMSAGPVTIEDGYTVTLEDGAVWIIF